MEGSEIVRKKNEGLIVALPVVVGYLPIAIGFGLLAKNTGITFRDTSLFSFVVYAGASQFMALDLIRAGVSMGSIILATFLLNLRHMMMSASLSVSFSNIDRRLLPLIAYGITDETFSVASFNKEKIDVKFILTLNILAWGSWVVGTMIGFLVGELLPSSLQSSLGIGLYAMFAALLFPEFKKSLNPFYLFIISGVLYMVLYYSKIFTSGWDIILGIILSSLLGVFFLKDKDGESNWKTICH